MKKTIYRPDGSEYMTVAATERSVEFRNFTKHGVTVRFDAKVLDQLVPFLTEVNFWNKVKEKNHETSD